MAHCRKTQKLGLSFFKAPLNSKILWYQDRMYVFRKESDAPAWLWESSYFEQSSVLANLNEFRVILDIHNELRVILGEEKRAGSLLSFLVLCISCPAHCRLRELWRCPPPLRSKQEPAPFSALPWLPLFPGPTRTVFWLSNPETFPFLKNKNHQLVLLPCWLLHLQTPNPINASLWLKSYQTIFK